MLEQSKLVLVRHGETEINKNNLTHKTGDAELLNATGELQIQKTAERLKELKPVKVYSSKESRAVHSGEIISKTLEIELESIDGMQERNWGDLSGKPWAEIQKVLEPMSLEERYTYTPPNGESWQTFEARLIKTVSEILEKNKGENIVIVSHGGAIRALMPFLLGVPKVESFKYNPDNASVTVFSKEGTVLKQEMINDTTHLF